MPRPYSSDLRARVLGACERGGASRAEIARLFGVGETTLYRWQQEARVEGRWEAEPHAGGPAPRLDAAALGQLRTLVAETNDLTLAEYAERLAERTGVRVSLPVLCKTLQQLGLTRKKASGRPSRTGRSWRRRGRLGGPSWPASTRIDWSSSTRAGSTRG